jgi:hypothetical protein
VYEDMPAATAPLEDVACINSWSGPLRFSYKRMFRVSS